MPCAINRIGLERRLPDSSTRNGAVAVEIGPKEFVERSGFKFSSGQIISVVGMPIVISHREMVLAREITTGDSVFVVRDRNGEWT